MKIVKYETTIPFDTAFLGPTNWTYDGICNEYVVIWKQLLLWTHDGMCNEYVMFQYGNNSASSAMFGARVVYRSLRSPQVLRDWESHQLPRHALSAATAWKPVAERWGC